MPFLELSLRVRAEDEARAEHALGDIGALSVTLLDADPGAPLWPEASLPAHGLL